MEALYLVCGARRAQLMRDPLDSGDSHQPMTSKSQHSFPASLSLVLALGATATCSRQQRTPGIRMDAASVCDRHEPHIVLDLPATGGFFLNTQPEDSAALAGYIRDYLPRLPRSRLFMVRADSSRGKELAWILPAVEGIGRQAYVPDTSCFTPIPDLGTLP